MALMLIIADDLTGAADCGVACASHGLHTVVVLSDSGGEANAEILSVDGDTRRLQPEEAAQETARLLRQYLRDEEPLLYKKLDSTLRGNVGEELAAVLAARRTLARTHEHIVAVLAPAFPGTGRTTLNGRQLVNGEPLEGARLFQDEHKAAVSDIAGMLRASHLRPALLGLELVRGERNNLRDAMKLMAKEADVLVCDADTDEDLHNIAEASMVLGRGTVWAGSAGLAWHLPPAAELARALVNSSRQAFAAGPALFVIGSGSAISAAQVEVLASRSDTIVMRISPEVLMSGEQLPQWREYGLELKRRLNAGSDVAVLPAPGTRLDNSRGPAIAAGLAAMVRPLGLTVGALVSTGGETARAVFEAWGVKRLRLIGEVEAGLPFSVTSGWSRELPVITKAGGFGGPDSLLRCREFLHELERGEATHSVMSKGPQCKGPQ
jgi:4-hydroxythreonine-4-phosphate dehydrogenase